MLTKKGGGKRGRKGGGRGKVGRGKREGKYLMFYTSMCDRDTHEVLYAFSKRRQHMLSSYQAAIFISCRILR